LALPAPNREIAMTGAADSRGSDLGLPGGTPPDPIVAQITEANARRQLRFRVLFVVTWVAVIGGLVLALAGAGSFDVPFLAEWAPFILGAVPLTIFIAISSIVLAIPFAVLGAVGRISVVAPVYALATLYVSLVRGTPLLVQIIFIVLGLPRVLPVVNQIPLLALGIFALAFNYGAYLTEIFRAGIEAVPRGQREAGAALGMSDRRIMLRIVLPQAIRIVTPAIGNEFIAMIKDSALVSIISIQELLWRAQRVGSANFRTLETLLLAAAMYWILTSIFSLFQERLEQRMARSDR
jgi:polar amino acid transport system permease protein